jgi:hypothetical protein
MALMNAVKMFAMLAFVAALAAPALATHSSDYAVFHEPSYAPVAAPYASPYAYTSPNAYRIQTVHALQYGYLYPQQVRYSTPYAYPYSYANPYYSYANPYNSYSYPYAYNTQPPVILDSYPYRPYIATNARNIVADRNSALVVLDARQPYDYPNIINPGTVYVHEDLPVSRYD